MNCGLFKNPHLKNTIQELSSVPLNYKNLQLAFFSFLFEVVRKHREKARLCVFIPTLLLRSEQTTRNDLRQAGCDEVKNLNTVPNWLLESDVQSGVQNKVQPHSSNVLVPSNTDIDDSGLRCPWVRYICLIGNFSSKHREICWACCTYGGEKWIVFCRRNLKEKTTWKTWPEMGK